MIVEQTTMKASIFIMSHSGATEYTARHWPFFKRCGHDLFGVTRIDTTCIWPEPILTKAIGKEGYIVGDDQCRRMVETFRWFNEDPRFSNYTHAWLMQGDVVLLGPIPNLEYDIAAHLAGGVQPGFISNRFYHPPWVVSRKIVSKFVKMGTELLDAGKSEQGIPDYFFALLCDTMGTKVYNIPGIVSYNSGDLMHPTVMGKVEAGIKAGAWYVHSAKTQAELEWILSCKPK